MRFLSLTTETLKKFGAHLSHREYNVKASSYPQTSNLEERG